MSRFLTMTPQQGGAPLVPRSLGGPSTPGSRGAASFTSMLIRVRQAQRAIRAAQGQHSDADLGSRRKIPASVVQSLPLYWEQERGCELTEDL
ncbi:hypothetical protein PAMA_009904 [Pampus argenteus]